MVTNRSVIWSRECKDCGRYLTATEEHFYGYRCEDCESLEHARVQALKEWADQSDWDDVFGV
jgi:Zn finger protein HypA/HybF involved in hydrogenase expression